VDEYTLTHGDLKLGNRFEPGILHATVNGQAILVKDAANRKKRSLRQSIPDGTDIQREYATYLFAKMVPGLVELPAMALRVVNGEQVLAMEKINGDHALWSAPKGVSVTLKRNMALFDAIVGNTDRHGQNYFIRRNAKGERRIIAIDHGLCFPIPNKYGEIDCGTSDFSRREALPQWCERWLNKILSMELSIRRTLAPYIEPEAIDQVFVRVNWMLARHTFMSKRDFMYRTQVTY
jgi:hypothetical protein